MFSLAMEFYRPTVRVSSPYSLVKQKPSHIGKKGFTFSVVYSLWVDTIDSWVIM